MNDTELDEMLNKWNAPAPAESLRERVKAGFHAGTEPRTMRWISWKSLTAGAVLAMGALLFLATQAVPQTMSVSPPRPYTVLSEFVRYWRDGSSTIEMYSTSYNDQYGREILLSRHIPDNSVHDTIARILDAASEVTAPIRLRLALLSPSASEMIAKQAAAAPSPTVNTQCADEMCISGVGHFALPKAAANPGIGCADGPVVDRETILGYPTVAIQLPLDGNWVRRTVWMAPALGCFALKVSTEAQQPDGRFRLLNGKQAVKVRLNTDPR